MSDRIIVGAFVIRNKQQSTVLHIEDSNFCAVGSSLLAYEQDESKFSNQQIWWVEPLSDYEDAEPEKGPVYSITAPASGMSLDMEGGQNSNPSPDVQGYRICAYKYHGEHWQRWRIRKTDDDTGVAFYTIVSVSNGQVIDINGSGSRLHSQTYVSGYNQHCWEFVVPVVGFPPGWLQIQNVGTGHLLSHTYLYNLPALFPPPALPRPSQYRESWEFQWVLVHSKGHNSNTTSPRNAWYITNRLTGAHIRSQLKVTILSSSYQDLEWQLELDPLCNWKIKNRASSCLLEQTNIPHGRGTAAACGSKNFVLEGGNKSWILRPPMLQTNNPSPPEYDSSAA